MIASKLLSVGGCMLLFASRVSQALFDWLVGYAATGYFMPLILIIKNK